MMRCGASRGWWRTFHRIASFLFSKSSVMFVHCSRIVHTLKLCCWYEHRVIRRRVRRPTVNDSHYSNLEARWRRIVNKVGKKKLMRCKTLMTTIRWRQQHQLHVCVQVSDDEKEANFSSFSIATWYLQDIFLWDGKRRQSFVFLLFKLMHTHFYTYLLFCSFSGKFMSSYLSLYSFLAMYQYYLNFGCSRLCMFYKKVKNFSSSPVVRCSKFGGTFIKNAVTYPAALVQPLSCALPLFIIHALKNH